jgi:hypothetical protein
VLEWRRATRIGSATRRDACGERWPPTSPTRRRTCAGTPRRPASAPAQAAVSPPRATQPHPDTGTRRNARPDTRREQGQSHQARRRPNQPPLSLPASESRSRSRFTRGTARHTKSIRRTATPENAHLEPGESRGKRAFGASCRHKRPLRLPQTLTSRPVPNGFPDAVRDPR